MKYFYAILWIGFLLKSPSVSSQSLNTASEYIDFVSNEHQKVRKKNLSYISKSTHSDNERKIEAKRQELIKQLEKSVQTLSKMSDFKGNKKFRDESVDILKILLDSYNTDGKEISSLIEKKKTLYDALDTYFKAQDRLEKKIDDANKQLKKAHQDFAKENNIIVVEKEKKDSDDVFQIISDLNTYKRQVELAFSKPHYGNMMFMTALSNKKVSEMESERKKILESSEESLKKLVLLSDFRGNIQYQDKAIAVVQFYKESAEKRYPTIVEMMKNYEKRTKEQVEGFNEVIKLFNEQMPKLINAYNAASQEISQKNVPMIEE
jgi:hypothetical protein